MNEKDYIYEVYKERSFSVAAKNLYVSQPALSASVKKVEKELGITIFDRSTSPITVTEEGRVYIDAIEKFRNIEEETKTILSDLNELKKGKLRVSGENFVSSFILPKIIMEYTEKYPGIDIEIIESNSPDLRQLLLSDHADLLIAHEFDHNLYSNVPILEETLLLAVPESFEVNKKHKDCLLTRDDIIKGKHLVDSCPKIDLNMFKDCPFLLLKKGNDTRRRAELLFNEAGFEPTAVKIYLDQLITSYNMICFGMGVGFVNDVLIKSSLQTGSVYYKLKGRASYRTMSVGYKKNRYLSKAMKAFIDIAKDIYKGK